MHHQPAKSLDLGFEKGQARLFPGHVGEVLGQGLLEQGVVEARGRVAGFKARTDFRHRLHPASHLGGQAGPVAANHRAGIPDHRRERADLRHLHDHRRRWRAILRPGAGGKGRRHQRRRQPPGELK